MVPLLQSRVRATRKDTAPASNQTQVDAKQQSSGWAKASVWDLQSRVLLPHLYLIFEIGLDGCLCQCCPQHHPVIPAVPASLQLSSSNVLLPCKRVIC
jgi:hypothetical protein